ncbi:MAG: hypothetical protein H7Z16_06950 [Pyrinomonadaceae bacterium]|nr:hypothetical protein [Pyrinomonadaceae bacterium]
MGISLQLEHEPIDKEIADSLISATPEWWKSAVLQIEYSFEDGIEGLAHEIISPEGFKDIVEPTEDLYSATLRLVDVFKRRGHVWRKAGYTVTQLPNGGWKYTVKFDY